MKSGSLTKMTNEDIREVMSDAVDLSIEIHAGFVVLNAATVGGEELTNAHPCKLNAEHLSSVLTGFAGRADKLCGLLSKIDFELGRA